MYMIDGTSYADEGSTYSGNNASGTDYGTVDNWIPGADCVGLRSNPVVGPDSGLLFVGSPPNQIPATPSTSCKGMSCLSNTMPTFVPAPFGSSGGAILQN
jgi:hypothetical protein